MGAGTTGSRRAGSPFSRAALAQAHAAAAAAAAATAAAVCTCVCARALSMNDEGKARVCACGGCAVGRESSRIFGGGLSDIIVNHCS